MKCLRRRRLGHRFTRGREVIFVAFFISSIVFFTSTLPNFVFPGADVTYPGDQVPMLIRDDGLGDVGVTIVTAFFDLGTYTKGDDSHNVTPANYVLWARTFRHLVNPLVVYTDSPTVMKFFTAIRERLHHMTKINIIDRKQLWSFKLRDRIARIYSNPAYPKFHPNTELPEYTCTQHAKYDVMEHAIIAGEFPTPYYAWLDIGYFRYIVDRNQDFRLTLPPKFNTSRVAVNLIYDTKTLEEEPAAIFLQNLVRFGGGLFLGERTVLDRFIAHYKRTTEHFLNQGLSDTDQQVLYAMFTHKHAKLYPPPVHLQCYSAPRNKGDMWFYLGYLCYRELL